MLVEMLYSPGITKASKIKANGVTFKPVLLQQKGSISLYGSTESCTPIVAMH